MNHLSIDVLGPLQVAISGRPVKLESAKNRALLAYLAVESDRMHTRSSLVGLFWPEFSEESARHNLRQALYNLRETLCERSNITPYLLVTRQSIQFNKGSEYSLDLDQFNRYFLAGKQNHSSSEADAAQRVSILEEMVKLYRGDFLQQLMVAECVEFEQWLLVQRENMHQRVLEAHSDLASYYEQRAEYQAARYHANKQLELDPWREEAHRQLMRVLSMGGQRSAALAQYETCKDVLAKELDVEPSVETRELYEQIRQGELRASAGVSHNLAPKPLNNLPVQLTPFIGRETELRQLRDSLTDHGCRCLTLIGPGGIGKTRLAVQAATLHLDRWAHGAAFVALAPVRSVDGVIQSMADTINFTFFGSGDLKTYLLNYLREKQMLVILDNVEHLLNNDDQHEQMTGVLIEILQTAPGVKLLITTRQALNIQGERIFEVQGLAYPQATQAAETDAYDAVALFVQRARHIFPMFELNNENRNAVVRICQLVEGMPLAIELAATWIRVLSPGEIANEIQNSLDFLSTTVHDLPERHRSMRVVFDHSWQMLSQDEQNVISKLSVFRGGFQRQVAEQVAGATLSILATLVNRTLIKRTLPGRYDLHELVRQYCANQLDANSQVKADTRARHFRFYLSMAEMANLEVQGSKQLDWLSQVEQEQGNLRVAIEWALDRDRANEDENESALRLCAALRWYWRMRGHFHEGISWLSEALEHYQPRQTIARAGALLAVSLLRNGLGDLGAARLPAQESVKIFRDLGDQEGLAEALLIEGLTLLWQGEAATGQSLTREALSLYRNVGDRWGEAQALYRLGSYLSDYGGDPAGRDMLEESASILEKLHEKYLYTSVLISLGIVDLSMGNYVAAQPNFEAGLLAARELRHPWGIADSLTNLGCLFRIQGDYVKAQSYFEEALRVYQELGRNIWETDVLCALAENAISQCDLPAAYTRLQAANRVLGSAENTWLQLLVQYFQGVLAFYEKDNQRAVEALQNATRLAGDGLFMPDLARALVMLGRVHLRMGEADQAIDRIKEGLLLFRGFKHKLGITGALEALAEVNAFLGNFRQTAMLIAATDSLRREMGAPLPPIEQPVHDSMIRQCKDTLGEETFRDSWGKATGRPIDEIMPEIFPHGRED